MLVAPPAIAQDEAPTRHRGLDPASALRASEAAIGRAVGEHLLLDRRERPVRLTDYRGKPLLVSFIYTGCFKVCPTTTQSLAVAVEQLARGVRRRQVQRVSIGFNQPFDSPTAMRAFAAQMGITASNWDFLSPAPGAVEAAAERFRLSLCRDPRRHRPCADGVGARCPGTHLRAGLRRATLARPAWRAAAPIAERRAAATRHVAGGNWSSACAFCARCTTRRPASIATTMG